MENGTLKVISLKDVSYIKVHGRTTKSREPLTLFWTGSGIELNVKSTEIWVEVEADYECFEPWISILVNGAAVSRQMVAKGRNWICLFRGMAPDTIKNVFVIRDVQAMSGDSACRLQIHSIKTDGELLPVEDKPYKVEIIGDSITSGEGVIGSKQENDWISMWFSATMSYPKLLADALNADWRVISQSGWGVLSSWDNNPDCALPNYYEKVCGLLTGENNRLLGANDDYDFSLWQPDVIVVNLGTNDCSAFYQPEWKDEESGRIFKQHINPDGSFEKDDLARFKKAVVEFLFKLRYYNKNAYIVWAIGMMETNLLPAIKHAIQIYQKESSDNKVSVVELNQMNDESVGARSHPGSICHQQAADTLFKETLKLLRN